MCKSFNGDKDMFDLSIIQRMVKQNIKKKDWKNKSEIFQKKEKNIKREYGRNRYENMFEE